MTIKYFDIHSHLNLEPLSNDIEGVISRMKELSVGTVTVGTGLTTSREAVNLARKYPEMLWATIGIHPTDAVDEVFDDQEFLTLAQDPKVVAIGETGLDYFRDQSEEIKQKQVSLFKQHIALAQKVHKPLMLHVRASKGSDDAYYDALEILKDYSSDAASSANDSSTPLKANFHFFSGTTKCMQDIIVAGFTVSVDGPITFVDQYDEMVRSAPIESLMIETDSPFAAPKQYRGKNAEPWMVIDVLKKVAELKGLDEEVVRAQILENVRKFFSLDF